ncbi:phenylalanine--tRNA ligase, chloroplastic/mitochondrial isoform X2 [Magnolia sinica]|uniref:phenylalanine--tRNA ligase, chloroplastic/mitochondrial isoform X2 n=1 Tax=Magnolia sinica TaxID=86752 RepID=UPI00265A5E61|nr:phenylalanine--tRNA ligase, chloroplastic/mitochondrial isoform X2 [Magnolia sinica]
MGMKRFLIQSKNWAGLFPSHPTRAVCNTNTHNYYNNSNSSNNNNSSSSSNNYNNKNNNMAISLNHSTLYKPSFLFSHRRPSSPPLRGFLLSNPFSSSSSATKLHHRSKQPPIASLLDIGGVKIGKEDVVRDDPTNNVPDTIFSKLGLQLHRRDHHPIGILKNTIYEYFENAYSNKFVKFDDLCPIVSVKQNFDDVLVPADHVSRSYNDTYYVDAHTVLRCHTSAHQAELLRNGHTHFLVTGDVYRRDSIDSTHYPVFHQMEGVRVFSQDDWTASGMDATSYAAMDLKKALEGLAQHLFGAVEMRWVDTYFPFTNPSFELEIYFQFSKGQLGVKFKPFSKFPPCYKDISFWISDSFTENNLCEIVRGIAGDLVEEVRLIDNFTNKKGMTSHCYRIAYRSMERSLTDEEINQLQWDVREAVQSKLNVVLR